MKLILKMDSAIVSASFDQDIIQENVPGEIRATFQNIPIPADYVAFEPKVLGSCNGLLCLSFTPWSILWNPSTRTHHVIPNEPASENGIKIDGLGYDGARDDFKLVRIVQLEGRRDAQIWVYSVNSGSWNMVDQVNWIVSSGGFTDAFVNGYLHFKLQTESDGMYQIVAFDVSKEKFRLIPKPKYGDTNSSFELGVLDGCLSMVWKRIREVETFPILKMKDYGCEKSWAEVSGFEMKDGPLWMRPITYVANQNNKRTLLLEGGGKLFCFVVESRQQVPINGMDSKVFTDVCVCRESQRILDTADDPKRTRICMQSD